MFLYLAEEWGWDDTNTILTFKLRQGVTFTDGTAFNAESVKAILEFDSSNPNFSGIKEFIILKVWKLLTSTQWLFIMPRLASLISMTSVSRMLLE